MNLVVSRGNILLGIHPVPACTTEESSKLISSSTKMAILELSDDDIEVLKEALSNTLGVILNLSIKSKFQVNRVFVSFFLRIYG